MMDVREKLVELIESARYWRSNTSEEIADYLIDHGVTVQENVEISDELLKQLKNAPITICKEEPSIEMVQEWISVKDRLPEKDGSYLVTANYFGNNQCIDVLGFVKDGETVDKYELAGQKYVWYFYDSEYGYVSNHSVTHWMPLPLEPEVKND